MTSTQTPSPLNMHDRLAKPGTQADDVATHLELELNGIQLSLEANPTLSLLELLRENWT